MNEETTKQPAASRRTVQGRIEKTKMDKTITVLVERQLPHPLYKKYIRRSTRLHAHDEKNECREGDTVLIEECRPLSKLKSWRLVRILERADVGN
ncbi:MAG: 30S ribosomal protein S17 [Arenicellales bacterium]|jgi:small subunit ribosomal protein S17|nr:30S ribosomal protein S17 [Arenicellales bacterium]MDP6854646.1 30S ribosomal protein S17 [Arenicellales bacterium]MDP6948572.1 30S ribosomal protein S17 [Arenicellales bacterium]